MGRKKHSPPLNFKPRLLPTQILPTFTLEETWLQDLEGGKQGFLPASKDCLPRPEQLTCHQTYV